VKNKEPAMKLTRIKIEKLFGQFDYDIKLNQDEGITILTGPNGYGKTTILKSVYALLSGHLHDVKYTKATIFFSDSRILEAPKDRVAIKNVIPAYFIKDQRIKRTVIAEKPGSIIHEKVKSTMDTIAMLSQELKGHIAKIRAKEDEKAKALNADYAKRLFKYDKAIPKAEFEERYEKLMERYQLLQKYKIYHDDLEKAEYEGENQRALSIYLEDWEVKVAIYDELLDKIELFLSIMGNKYLTNKTFTINAKEGFCFVSANGKSLQLDKLSSGEQHQTILLYELLFNAPPNSLVLIDEPETSMHVAWQIEFLHDIEKIAKISNLSFIIATHSPDLINDKMDLCVDLFENDRSNGNDGK
jgi:predicted ATP-binding protein involved in virulence